jgi:hypothetical protein
VDALGDAELESGGRDGRTYCGIRANLKPTQLYTHEALIILSVGCGKGGSHIESLLSSPLQVPLALPPPPPRPPTLLLTIQ